MSNVKWNLWRSIESALLLQRIFFVSPFELNHWTGRLTSTFFTKMYVISVFTAAAAIVYISLFKWHCVNLIMKLMPSGFLWSLLTGYEIVSINVHFILNTWLSYINKKKQIKFLHTLHSIDGQLLTEFRAKVDFKKHRRWLNIEVALICIYYLTIAVGAARIWYELGHLEMIPLLIVYQFQWVCLCLPIYMSANYLLLIQSRYEVLYKTYRKLQVEYSGYVRACKPNKIISTHFLNKLQKIIEIFKEITNLIDILNNAFGWLFLVSIVKSFAMILIQAYLLVFMLTNGTDSVDKDLSPFVVLYSLSGEFIKVMMNLIALMKIFSAVCSSSKFL